MRKITGEKRRESGVVKREEGNYVKNDIWVLDTTGTNLLQVLALDTIDQTRTVSNDIQEIYRVLGIEAARVAILTEITESFDTTYINHHHLSVLCDRMTANESMVSIFRHGINNDNIGPIAKASFEETPEMFLKAARHAELDNMRGVSANVMCGQEGYYGTSSFQVLLNLRAMANAEVFSSHPVAASDGSKMEMDNDATIDDVILVADKHANTMCSVVKLEMHGSNAVGIKAKDLGAVSSSYDLGF
jgi:DNA-directed RNA polymerase II subunit RPB1